MPFNASFNDVYDFGFTNQKQKDNIDFEKDDIYLETIEIKSNSRKRFKLDKPNLALLKGDSFVKYDIKPSFTSKLKGNDNFDIITKSVSADFKTSILYKTTFDFEGKKIKELVLTMNFNDKKFIRLIILEVRKILILPWLHLVILFCCLCKVRSLID